jgi:hypothetical protein
MVRGVPRLRNAKGKATPTATGMRDEGKPNIHDSPGERLRQRSGRLQVYALTPHPSPLQRIENLAAICYYVWLGAGVWVQ